MDYEAWKYLHIMMLTFWLGTDMGVMLVTKKSTDQSLSPEVRYRLLEMALIIELLPRIMWTLAFLLGMHFARNVGLVEVSDDVMELVSVVTAAFFITNVGSAFLIGKPLGNILSRINNIFIPILGVVLIVLGIWSYLGDGLFLASWLSAKIAIFGVIFLTTYGILWAFEPTVPFYLKLLEEGSTPEIEAGIKKGVGKTLFFVYFTYILIAFVAFVGVFKIF